MFDRAQLIVFGSNNHAAMDNFGVAEKPLIVIDGPAHHITGLQHIDPMVGGIDG